MKTDSSHSKDLIQFKSLSAILELKGASGVLLRSSRARLRYDYALWRLICDKRNRPYNRPANMTSRLVFIQVIRQIDNPPQAETFGRQS